MRMRSPSCTHPKQLYLLHRNIKSNINSRMFTPFPSSRSPHILQCHLQHPSSHQPLPTKTHPPLHHKPHPHPQKQHRTPYHRNSLAVTHHPPTSTLAWEGSSRIDESPPLNCVESSRSFPFFFRRGDGLSFGLHEHGR